MTVTACPGCQSWQVDYDLHALAAEELADVTLVNEHGGWAPGVALRRAAAEVDMVLWEHLADCPPGRAWLDQRLRHREEVRRARHPARTA